MSETIKKEIESEVVAEAVQPEVEADQHEEVKEKPYTFRKLSSPDVFHMFRIISKIGVNEFTACFEKDVIKKMIAKLTGNKNEDESEEGQSASIVGISVALEIANVIFMNIPKCESDIYTLLSQTSNLSVDEVKELDFVTFTEMVIDFIKKEEFKDFIKVVSKLFK